MVMPALERGGYRSKTQVYVGRRPGGRKQKVDVVAQDRDGRHILISLKWQQTSGTAEQKVPFEVICLAEAVSADKNGQTRAYLVLGGSGWTLRDFFTGGGLEAHLKNARLVKILALESFVARANKGDL